MIEGGWEGLGRRGRVVWQVAMLLGVVIGPQLHNHVFAYLSDLVVVVSEGNTAAVSLTQFFVMDRKHGRLKNRTLLQQPERNRSSTLAEVEGMGELT